MIISPANLPVVEGLGANPILSDLAQKLRQPEKKECWRNSFIMAASIKLHIPVEDGPVYYCEGWAVHQAIPGLRLPLEHGWLEIRGKIVETTWDDSTYDSAVYFPVVRFTIREALELVEKQDGHLPILMPFGGDYLPPDTTQIQAAQYSAHVYAYGEEVMNRLMGMGVDRG